MVRWPSTTTLCETSVDETPSRSPGGRRRSGDPVASALAFAGATIEGIHVKEGSRAKIGFDPEIFRPILDIRSGLSRLRAFFP